MINSAGERSTSRTCRFASRIDWRLERRASARMSSAIASPPSSSRRNPLSDSPKTSDCWSTSAPSAPIIRERYVGADIGVVVASVVARVVSLESVAAGGVVSLPMAAFDLSRSSASDRRESNAAVGGTSGCGRARSATSVIADERSAEESFRKARNAMTLTNNPTAKIATNRGKRRCQRVATRRPDEPFHAAKVVGEAAVTVSVDVLGDVPGDVPGLASGDGCGDGCGDSLDGVWRGVGGVVGGTGIIVGCSRGLSNSSQYAWTPRRRLPRIDDRARGTCRAASARDCETRRKPIQNQPAFSLAHAHWRDRAS